MGARAQRALGVLVGLVLAIAVVLAFHELGGGEGIDSPGLEREISRAPGR